MRIRTLFLLWFSLLISICGQAGERPEVYAVCGDSMYAKGNYHQAISMYETVIRSGYESAELYYNLGNAYYRVGTFPLAILFYEKALKLDPGNEDAAFNLQLANTKIIDKTAVEALPVYKRAWKKLTEIMTLKNWGIFIIVMLAMALIGVGVYLLTQTKLIRKLAFWLGLVFLFLFLLSNVCAYSAYIRIGAVHNAIIFEPSLTVKSSPDEASSDIFVLHEGTKVKLSDRIGEWCEIRLENGGVGWVKMETLREI